MTYCRTCGEFHSNTFYCDPCLDAMERAVELPTTKRVTKDQQIAKLKAQVAELEKQLQYERHKRYRDNGCDCNLCKEFGIDAIRNAKADTTQYFKTGGE